MPKRRSRVGNIDFVYEEIPAKKKAKAQNHRKQVVWEVSPPTKEWGLNKKIEGLEKENQELKAQVKAWKNVARYMVKLCS